MAPSTTVPEAALDAVVVVVLTDLEERWNKPPRTIMAKTEKERSRDAVGRTVLRLRCRSCIRFNVTAFVVVVIVVVVVVVEEEEEERDRCLLTMRGDEMLMTLMIVVAVVVVAVVVVVVVVVAVARVLVRCCSFVWLIGWSSP